MGSLMLVLPLMYIHLFIIYLSETSRENNLSKRRLETCIRDSNEFEIKVTCCAIKRVHKIYSNRKITIRYLIFEKKWKKIK